MQFIFRALCARWFEFTVYVRFYFTLSDHTFIHATRRFISRYARYWATFTRARAHASRTYVSPTQPGIADDNLCERCAIAVEWTFGRFILRATSPTFPVSTEQIITEASAAEEFLFPLRSRSWLVNNLSETWLRAILYEKMIELFLNE